MPRARAAGGARHDDSYGDAVVDNIMDQLREQGMPPLSAGQQPWTEEQCDDAMATVVLIRARALDYNDWGFRAWQTFMMDGRAVADLFAALYGTLQAVNAQGPGQPVSMVQARMLLDVLDSLNELLSSPFLQASSIDDGQREMLKIKGQRVAAALLRSQALHALARLLAADAPFQLSREAKVVTYKAIADVLHSLFRLGRVIQEEVSDGVHAAEHAAAKAAARAAARAAAAAAGPSNGGRRRAPQPPVPMIPELSPDGKRSVLAEQVVAAAQASGVLEHLSRAALRLACGRAAAAPPPRAHDPNSCVPALEAVALWDPGAEARSALSRLQGAVLDALDFYCGVYLSVPPDVDEDGDALERPGDPLGVCAQWYFNAHILAQVAASELHEAMLPYRVMAAERAIGSSSSSGSGSSSAAAGAKRPGPAAAAASAGAGGAGQGAAGVQGAAVMACVREWLQDNGMGSDASLAQELSGLLEATVYNVELYGLDPGSALPRPVVEGCGGCSSADCASGVPLLRSSTFIAAIQTWMRTAVEPAAGMHAYDPDAASRPGFHLLHPLSKMRLSLRIANATLARWADSAERAQAAAAAAASAAAAAAAAGPSGSQQQPQSTAAAEPAPEPSKRTRPLTQKELRQQAAAAKKAQAAPAGKKGGGSGAAAASASERARRETEEEQRGKRKRAWLLGGLPPESCPQLVVMSLTCAATMKEFAVARGAQEAADELTANQRQVARQLGSGGAGGEAAGGSDASAAAAAGVGAAADGTGDGAPATGGAAGAADGKSQPATRWRDVVAASLPVPEDAALGKLWWTTALRYLRLLGSVDCGEAKLQGTVGLGDLLKHVMAGAGTYWHEHAQRVRLRRYVGWVESSDDDDDSDWVSDSDGGDDEADGGCGNSGGGGGEGSHGGSGTHAQAAAAASSGTPSAAAAGPHGEGEAKAADAGASGTAGGSSSGFSSDSEDSEDDDDSEDVEEDVDGYLANVHRASLIRGLQLGLLPGLEGLMRQLLLSLQQRRRDKGHVAAAVVGAVGAWDSIERLLQLAPRPQAATLLVSVSKLAVATFELGMATAKSAKGVVSSGGLQEADELLEGAMRLQLQPPLNAVAAAVFAEEMARTAKFGRGGANARMLPQQLELLSLGLASYLPAARRMLDLTDAATINKIVALARKDQGGDGIALSLRDLVLRAADWVQVLVQAAVLAAARGDVLAAASWDAFVLRGIRAQQLAAAYCTISLGGLLHRGGPRERMVVRTVELLWARYSQEIIAQSPDSGRADPLLTTVGRVVKKESLPAWWQAGQTAAPPQVLEELALTNLPVGPSLDQVAALTPPSHARNRLGVCANLGCAACDGASERDMPLTVVCGGCGVSRYCSQRCMEEHAREYDHTARVCALMRDAAAQAAAGVGDQAS